MDVRLFVMWIVKSLLTQDRARRDLSVDPLSDRTMCAFAHDLKRTSTLFSSQKTTAFAVAGLRFMTKLHLCTHTSHRDWIHNKEDAEKTGPTFVHLARDLCEQCIHMFA